MSEYTLSKSAQSIQDALSKKGLIGKVVELSASTRTAQQAAETIGCDVAQIVKSLLFCTEQEKKPILLLVSGVNRVNEKVIAEQIGVTIVKADADFTREVTGFAIGGIPPIGHKQKIDTFIDSDLLALQELWAAGGTPNAVFSLKAADLVSLTDGKVIKVQ